MTSTKTYLSNNNAVNSLLLGTKLGAVDRNGTTIIES